MKKENILSFKRNNDWGLRKTTELLLSRNLLSNDE